MDSAESCCQVVVIKSILSSVSAAAVFIGDSDTRSENSCWVSIIHCL
jgi:hypothetical protein